MPNENNDETIPITVDNILCARHAHFIKEVHEMCMQIEKLIQQNIDSPEKHTDIIVEHNFWFYDIAVCEAKFAKLEMEYKKRNFDVIYDYEDGTEEYLTVISFSLRMP